MHSTRNLASPSEDALRSICYVAVDGAKKCLQICTERVNATPSTQYLHTTLPCIFCPLFIDSAIIRLYHAVSNRNRIPYRWYIRVISFGFEPSLGIRGAAKFECRHLTLYFILFYFYFYGERRGLSRIELYIRIANLLLCTFHLCHDGFPSGWEWPGCLGAEPGRRCRGPARRLCSCFSQTKLLLSDPPFKGHWASRTLSNARFPTDVALCRQIPVVAHRALREIRCNWIVRRSGWRNGIWWCSQWRGVSPFYDG